MKFSGIPFLEQPVIDYITATMPRNGIMFEYGSGNSTIYFAQFVKQVISVENSTRWYKLLAAELPRRNLTNVQLHFIPVDPSGRGSDPSDPKGYTSRSGLYKNRLFTHYASFINTFPDETFDWITIDGRSRPSCFMNAIPKVRVGGYLFLDDSGRERYQKAIQLLDSNWKVVFHHIRDEKDSEGRSTVWRKQ